MHFEIYRDASNEFRWRLVSRNGRIVGDSGEGYKRKAEVKKRITDIAEAFDSEVMVCVGLTGEDYTV